MAMTNDEVKAAVRAGYSERVERNDSCGCCGGDEQEREYLVRDLGYTREQLKDLPQNAQVNAFGCGNPLSFAEVQAGDVVLDIGSGAGIDCLIAAEKVGDEGKVIGLDMTPAMIARATENAIEAGAENVEFRLGDAEDMPVEDGSVDWVVSNCVINLAPDKERVFSEVQRVLKNGGQLAVSDIVLGGELPAEVAQNFGALVGCLGGAVREDDYLQAMRDSGLQDVRVSERRVYEKEDIAGLLDCGCGSEDASALVGRYADSLGGNVWSARLHARKG